MAIQQAIFTNISPEDAKPIISAYTALEDLENLYGRYAETAFDLIASYEDNDDDMNFPRFLSASFMDFLYAEEETMLSIATLVEKDPIKPWWDAPV